MGWSDWYECSFNDKGEVDTQPVERYAPHSPGIYAIATKTGWGYNVQYIGMSKSSIWRRLQAHFSGRGNRIIRAILEDRKVDDKGEIGRATERLNALYFMFLETSREQAPNIEALYVLGTTPIANIQQNLSLSRLPSDLQDFRQDVELED